jgi:hypothetical protein
MNKKKFEGLTSLASLEALDGWEKDLKRQADSPISSSLPIQRK